MEKLYNCCRWRLALIGTAIIAWLVSLGADIAWQTGWDDSGISRLSLWCIIAGIVTMLFAAAISGYELWWQDNSRAAKAELLDVGVMFAAVILFGMNAAIRQRFGDSPLTLILTFLGVAGVLAELFLDVADAQDTFSKVHPK